MLTKIIKSNLNPIIINGLNYYKVKDSVVTKDIVNDTYYKQIHNNCSNNNLTYNLFFKNNEIKLDNTYSIAFNDVKIDSLDLYDYKKNLYCNFKRLSHLVNSAKNQAFILNKRLYGW